MNKKLVKTLFLSVCFLIFFLISSDVSAETESVTSVNEECDKNNSPCTFYKSINNGADYQAFSGSWQTNRSSTKGNWRVTMCFAVTHAYEDFCSTWSWNDNQGSDTLTLQYYATDNKAYNYIKYIVESDDHWVGDFGRDSVRFTIEGFSVSPDRVGQGGSTTITWHTTNAYPVDLDGIIVSGTGSTTYSNLQGPGTLWIWLEVCGPRGNDDGCERQSRTVLIDPDIPWIDINAIPTSVGEGGITTLTWRGENATNCGAKSEPLGDWSGGLPLNGSESVGPLTGGPRDVEFIITCKDPNTGLRNVTDSVIVGIGQAPPGGGGGGGGFLDPFCERLTGKVAMKNPSWWWRNSNFSQTDWCESRYSCANPTEGDVGGFDYIIIDKCASGTGFCGDSGHISYNPCTHPFSIFGSGRKNWGPIPFSNCDQGYFTGNKTYFDNPSNPNSDGNAHSKFSKSLRPLRLYELQAWVVKKDCNECVKGGGWTCGASCGKLRSNIIGPSCSGIPSVNIESPASGETVTGTITIKGWTLDFQTDLTNARFLVDGNQIIGSPPSALGYGQNRPSVCQTQYWDAGYPVYFDKAGSFPPGCPPDPADSGNPPTTAHPDNSTVGYSFTFDTRVISNGSHTLRVEFADDDSIGGTGDAGFVYEDQVGFAQVTINVDNPVGADMILFQDPSEETPDGWTCISCNPGDPFYQKFVVGSGLYGTFGGSDTHTHAVTISGSTGAAGAHQRIDTDPEGPAVGSNKNHTHAGNTGATNPASNIPRYRNLKVIRTNGTPSSLPEDVIALFDTEGVPGGFSAYNSQDNYYIRGGGVGGTGGSNTHMDTGTVNTGSSASGWAADSFGNTCQSTLGHFHPVPVSVGPYSNEPKHALMRLGQTSDDISIPIGTIAMFGGPPNPENWEILSGPGGNLNNDFLKGSNNPDFTDFGANTHIPANAQGVATGIGNIPSEIRGFCGWGSKNVSDRNHTHTVDVTFGEANYAPPYRGVIIAKKIGGATPTVSNVTINNNFCTTSLGTNISWTYSDPDNDPQDHYQVQIDNNSNFNSPEYDSCLVIPDTCQSGFSAPSHSTPPNILEFDETYYIRVKVWDITGQASDFQKATICTGEGCKNCPGSSCRWETPIHAYPYPDFTYTPSQPSVDQEIQFTDSTIFYGGATGLAWNWDFGDGDTGSGNPVTHTYTAENTFTVTETVTDTENFTCDTSKTLDIKKPIPFYKEIAPK